MSKFAVFAGWDDVPHLSAEAKAGLASAYQPHERDARMKGVPSLGSGAIYPVPESDIVCDAFEFPAWFEHSYGLDVGWNRTAAVWTARDPETDVLYIYAEYYRGQAEPAVHAAAIRARGEWIPGVIDPAARGRGQADGAQLMQSYLDLGLMLEKADNGVYTGIGEVWTRLSTGRLKVFRHMHNWLAEYRIYRRDEKGAIVKVNDHLMDATRYLLMSGVKRGAIRPPEQWGGRPGSPPTWDAARGTNKLESEYDPYAAAKNIHNAPREYQNRTNWLPGVR